MRIAKALIVLVLVLPSLIHAETLPCLPCAGVVVDGHHAVNSLLEGPSALDPDAVFFVSSRIELDGSAEVDDLAGLSEHGATPWLSLVFRTPSPITSHLERLANELEKATDLVKRAPAGTFAQVVWIPATEGPSRGAADYAFLFKRAAVAIAGANRGARVVSGALAHDEAALRALYAEGVAAYVDAVAVAPADDVQLRGTIATITELDPGQTIVVDAVDLPDEPSEALVIAARNAAAGAAVTLFRVAAPTDDVLEPFEVLAREFRGDLSFDPYSTPSGAEAFAFVRGEDLGLRVIARTPGEGDRAELVFSDRQLTAPTRVLMNGSERTVYARSTAAGLAVPVDEPEPVTVIRLDRLTAQELGGFAEQVDVASTWQMPVEEILRRLQVFEDAQARRLHHYEAMKTMHLRFSPGQGVATIEVAFKGDFFHRPETGFDWAWQLLYINGVKWRGTLPELPLIQPEKAASLPFAIHFTKEYRYSLRRTAVVEGRDCWVVDFEPAGNGEQGNLYRGTVWVDRQLYTRVKTRAIQIGLEGDVISNEETAFFYPVDAAGNPSDWSPESFFLPVRTVGQEVQLLLNATFPVERETVLDRIRINAEGFDDRLAEVHASDDTMVRDTEQGMRYLERTADGAREVNDDVNFDSLSLVGGVFYDENQDYPLPLLGLNYFSRDFRGSGKQLNVFFAGIMINANLSEPQLFGSQWDAGARLFGFFVPGTEVLYRDGIESEEEAIKRRGSRLALYLGRPIGTFSKLRITYGLDHENYKRADETADDFVLPMDTFTNSLGLELSYSRGGYSFEVDGASYSRSDWDFWGLPDNTEYDPDQKDYLKWGISFSKAWYMQSFMKLAVAFEHLDGDNLDRFSKYDFSTFSDASVGGYQSGLVTASEANGVHLSYGFNMAETLRVDLRGDAVWASDEATGLDNELLAGVSLNGTTIGPWQTVVNFDIGYPVQGPADGFTVSIAFLKLFDWGGF